MSNVVHIGDVIDLDKLTPFQSILLEAIKEGQRSEIDPMQFVLLAIDHSHIGGVTLLYSFDNKDEESLILAKGYLSVLQSQANRQLEKPDD
tara:strand:+ start:1818 stop:2090 length:273 start_codon:yes stop_codon:yes gene_type:complete